MPAGYNRTYFEHFVGASDFTSGVWYGEPVGPPSHGPSLNLSKALRELKEDAERALSELRKATALVERAHKDLEQAGAQAPRRPEGLSLDSDQSPDTEFRQQTARHKRTVEALKQEIDRATAARVQAHDALDEAQSAFALQEAASWRAGVLLVATARHHLSDQGA